MGIIPGPGGLLVLIAGLWLLARNHKWAERLLKHAKNKGLNLVDVFFVDKPAIQALYDCISTLLIMFGIYVLDTRNGTLPIVIGTLLNLLGLSIFLGNRQRIQIMTSSLTKFFSRKAKKY